jgi:hypothetical protein
LISSQVGVEETEEVIAYLAENVLVFEVGQGQAA